MLFAMLNKDFSTILNNIALKTQINCLELYLTVLYGVH